MPAKLTVTGFRYQPLPSGLRSGDAVTAGGVASYLKPTLAGALAFPATSVQVPESEADALSPPPYVGLLQPAIPETASWPLNAAATGWLNQPFESGARASAAPLTLGAVLSIFTVDVAERRCRQ